MTRYQVDSEAIVSASGAVHGSIGRLQAEYAALHGHLTNLESSWSGPAATAFQSVVADWKATQQQVEQSLTALNTALGHAAQQYADIELANARMFAG